MMKVCYRCKLNQDESEFNKDLQKKDGLYSSCKSCVSSVSTSKAYREMRKHPKYAIIKRKHKVSKYGLTMEQYDALIESQGNCCAICGIHADKLSKVLSIDHDHSTNRVRGLLCGNCNRGLGYFKDNPEILKEAVEYVAKNS